MSFARMPFYVSFNFASASEGNLYPITQPIPYSVAIYGICVSASVDFETGFYNYTLEFQDYDTGETLFDEPIQGFNIQTDVRTYWKLPSKWWIRKNSKIICKLNVFDATFASPIDTVTYYVTLLTHLEEVDPNPYVKPFVYSFRQAVGFEDITSGVGVLTSNSMTRSLTGAVAKPARERFEIHSLILDAWSEYPYFSHLPVLSFQVTADGKKLFDRMVIDGVAGGGNNYNQGNTTVITTTTTKGFPRDNNLQYVLPRPVSVRKRGMMRVDFSPAPTYLDSDGIHSILNQQCCMALIGNHIYE